MRMYDFRGNRNLCGKRIQQNRKSRNLSQTELASLLQEKDLKLHRVTISRIELGIRYVADYELNVFADVLGVTMKELVEMPEEESTD